MNRYVTITQCLIINLVALSVFVHLSAQTIGPETGTCIIAGGGVLDSSIYDAFAAAAGGFDQPIVVIPTATSPDPELKDPNYKQLKRRFKNLGFEKVDIVHTIQRSVADEDSFALRIGNANGIWFTGGRQWRLVDSYSGTKSMAAFQQVLAKGGVIGGTSAGATIQGSFLARGDTKTNTIMMGDHQVGFGFIENVAIDQHLLRRNRHFDMLEILDKHPHLLGIGLDENTALVIQENRAHVIGKSYVVIYDGTRYDASKNNFVSDSKSFHFLGAGQHYDLLQREIIK